MLQSRVRSVVTQMKTGFLYISPYIYIPDKTHCPSTCLSLFPFIPTYSLSFYPAFSSAFFYHTFICLLTFWSFPFIWSAYPPSIHPSVLLCFAFYYYSIHPSPAACLLFLHLPPLPSHLSNYPKPKSLQCTKPKRTVLSRLFNSCVCLSSNIQKKRPKCAENNV